MAPIPRTSAIVLCGGMSSRMGRAKALLPWRGRPMVWHVSEILLEVVCDVVVVTSDALRLDAIPFGHRVRVVVDRAAELGPLAGIRDGLGKMSGDRAFVTGTDVPRLSTAFVRGLFAFDGAVAPEIDGHVQSLTAIYPKSAAAAAENLVTSGRMRPLFLLEAARYRKISPESLPDVESVRGFNTPGAYLAALENDGQRERALVELEGMAASLAGRAELRPLPGYLGEILRAAGLEELVPATGPGRKCLISLNGRPLDSSGNLAMPIGPGDRVVVSC